MSQFIKQLLRKTIVENRLPKDNHLKNCPICKYCLENDYMIFKNIEMKNLVQIQTVENLGIENIKDAFTIVINLSTKVTELFKDFTIQRALSLAFELAEHKKIISIFQQSLQEFKDLSVSESKELSKHFEINFDIKDNMLEEKIESFVNLLPKTYETIKMNIELVFEWKTNIQDIKSLPQAA